MDICVRKISYRYTSTKQNYEDWQHERLTWLKASFIEYLSRFMLLSSILQRILLLQTISFAPFSSYNISKSNLLSADSLGSPGGIANALTLYLDKKMSPVLRCFDILNF